jgi:multiple sugar transport system permease protein
LDTVSGSVAVTAPAGPASNLVTAIGPRRSLWRRLAGHQNNNVWFWVFVGPFVLGLTAFVVVPIAWSAVLSLYEARNTLSPTEFVGLDNYADMLGDPAFRSSLLTFVAFAAFIVPLTFVCSLGLALLVNSARIARSLFRSVFFLPVACSYVVASLIWKMSIFNGLRFGLANTVLSALGFEGRQWLSRPEPPLYWVVIVTERLWLQVGFYMLLFLAGLQRIPRELYQAAAVDGASSGWQTFRHITFPQLRATSAAVVVLLLISAFQAFDEFYNLLANPLAPGGGSYPPYARPPLVYLYFTALGRQQDFGHGSAGAVILTAMIALFTIVQARLVGFGRTGSYG